MPSGRGGGWGGGNILMTGKYEWGQVVRHRKIFLGYSWIWTKFIGLDCNPEKFIYLCIKPLEKSLPKSSHQRILTPKRPPGGGCCRKGMLIQAIQVYKEWLQKAISECPTWTQFSIRSAKYKVLEEYPTQQIIIARTLGASLPIYRGW